MDDNTAVPESRDGDRPDASGSDLGRGIVWVAIVAIASVFIAVYPVSTYRGTGLHGTARLWDIWRSLAGQLPLPSAALLILGLIFLIGVGWALWLALVASDQSTAATRLHPPKWALGSLLPIALVFVALVLWEAPRDDVTAESLISETGLEQTMIPTACAGFLDEAAAFRSGNVELAPTERAAASSCRSAIATVWPTRSAGRATGVAIWETVEAAGR